MQGVILQVSISPGGLPKLPIPTSLITTLGLEKDGHNHPQFHGGPDRAVLLIANEVLEDLKSRGFPVFPGAMGENLTTSGIDVRAIRIGHRLRAGTAELQVSKIRVPCGLLDVYGESLKRVVYDSQVKAGDWNSPRWGMSGYLARVITPGEVRTGDIISVEAP